jgi:hypothetical protein
MMHWEYHKIDLNQVRRRGDVLDLLDDAGKDGWELVVIVPNNLAYFKRAVEQRAAAQKSDPPSADAQSARDRRRTELLESTYHSTRRIILTEHDTVKNELLLRSAPLQPRQIRPASPLRPFSVAFARDPDYEETRAKSCCEHRPCR